VSEHPFDCSTGRGAGFTFGSTPGHTGRPGLQARVRRVTAPPDSNASGSRHSSKHGSEHCAAGPGRSRTVKDRLGVKGSGVVSVLAAMDLRRGTLGAHQLGIRQQAPTNVGKLRRWSGSFLTLTRWSGDGTNFVRLTGQLVRPKRLVSKMLLSSRFCPQQDWFWHTLRDG
jgi:hypothetical protein